MQRSSPDPPLSLISHQMMAASSRPPARRGPSGAWNRLRTTPSDVLDTYGLPSKGETRLHDFKAQEAYYAKIVERYMKFCASSGDGEELEKAFAELSLSSTPNPALIPESVPRGLTGRPSMQSRSLSTTERPHDLEHILMAMRKLREAIVGSHRCDLFAQRAYMFIIHASILTRHTESYHPALLYLLNTIHTRTPLSPPELQEFAGYLILDFACRQDELAYAFATKVAYRHRDRRVAAILKALVRDDWVQFWRTRRAVDGYQRALVAFAEERVRLHALKSLGRSYLNADKAYVERLADAKWDDLVKAGVGWQLQETGNVVIRKPKPK